MELTEEELRLVEELARIMAEEEKMLVRENPKKQLESIVSEKLFGPGVVDKRVNVKWGVLFSKDLCPACDEKMRETEGEHTCAKCGLRIPTELYNKAKEWHMKETKLGEKEFQMREQIVDKMKLSQKRIDEIYSLAVERSERLVKKDET
ncbi:MAG: hypothetical protein FJY77_01710 [Candidatus Altiarchaeales archaeon]|nr:hypothetical protein [Candidatus Altiarchaeales archaeon]